MTKQNRSNKRTPSKSMEVTVAKVFRNMFNKRVEKKVISSAAIGQSVVTAGTTINLTNAIVEGDDINMRSGTIIRLSRVRVLWRATATTTSSSIRFVLFRDMLNQGTTPAVSELLPSGTWISQYADTREMQQSRFHIVRDVTMDLPIAGANVKTLQFDIPLDGVVYYNGATAVAASNGKGAMFLIVIGNAITTAYDYTVQTVYTDA